MRNDNKTLADVQPGGRVRLGDAPWPEIDAILADAYSAGAEGLPFEGIARRAAVRKAVAALSAQPSPGGQGDAPEIEQIRTLVSSILSTVSLGHQKGPYAYAGEDFGRYLAEATRDCRAILRALSDLAARQPEVK